MLNISLRSCERRPAPPACLAAGAHGSSASPSPRSRRAWRCRPMIRKISSLTGVSSEKASSPPCAAHPLDHADQDRDADAVDQVGVAQVDDEAAHAAPEQPHDLLLELLAGGAAQVAARADDRAPVRGVRREGKTSHAHPLPRCLTISEAHAVLARLQRDLVDELADQRQAPAAAARLAARAPPAAGSAASGRPRFSTRTSSRPPPTANTSRTRPSAVAAVLEGVDAGLDERPS